MHKKGERELPIQRLLVAQSISSDERKKAARILCSEDNTFGRNGKNYFMYLY